MTDGAPLSDWDDSYAQFTLQSYARLCAAALDRYRCLLFRDAPDEPGVIWRHDVDVSLRQALRVAEIEAALGVVATYFVLPHSPLYNLWSDESVEVAKRIAGLGHDLGLHFDVAFYGERLEPYDVELHAGREKDWLECLLDVEVATISFHNFSVVKERTHQTERVAGMVNAYGSQLQSRYHYVSDSNGLWRFEDLFEIIDGGAYERLQALTHPVWWADEPMPPRRRLQRCIDETATEMGEWYEEFTKRHGRTDVP